MHPVREKGSSEKDPKAVDEWSPENVKHCSARQNRILLQAKDLVAPGGFLIYSTCTFNEEENDLRPKSVNEHVPEPFARIN